MVEGKKSIIGQSMVITGDVECRGSIVLEGKIHGTFIGTELLITGTGHISGSIKGEYIECFGRIEGDIITRSLVLRKTGCHSGTVEVRELEVEPGAILDCALQSGMERMPRREIDKIPVQEDHIIVLSELLSAFKEERRPCCMDVPLSERQELYGHILEMLGKGKPLIKVTGESGSGKSVLVEKVQKTLPDNYEVLLVADQVGAVASLVQSVAADLGVDNATAFSQEALVVEIKNVLKRKRSKGKRVVLLVDDTQLMYPATMEGIIRLLTAAYGEREEEELLQMILLGTEAMEAQMVATTIEYFEDETNCQFYLEPLTIKDTAEYLKFCLQLAAKDNRVDCSTLLPYEAIRRMYSLSRGNIGEINRLADNAFRSAHAAGANSIELCFVM